MRIGVLSRRTGISVRMLRYYEAEGLLTPARQMSGYREYDATDEETVRRIRLLSAAGLKLDLIRRFLPCVTSDKPDFHPCPQLLAAIGQEISGIDARIASLSESRRILAGYLDAMTETTEASVAAEG